MSGTRACLQCRTAKVKCDLARPSCGRCERRRLACTGYPTGEYGFRDETANAQRLSERARSERPGRTVIGTFDIEVPDVSEASTFITIDTDLQQQYHWLSRSGIAELPEPLKRDIESRAVERFFVNWTVHPSDVSPGHMHDLPALYYNSPTDSVLRFAVRAVAFADMPNARDSEGTSFALRSQSSYGGALARMRAVSSDEIELADDRILAGLLVIDYYESLYLARDEPLGRHIDAVRYIVRARGVEQLHSQSRFCIWRVANWRLQARQILLGEELDAAQNELLSRLNLEQSELHISADVLHITQLCAAAKDVLTSDLRTPSNADRTEELMRSIEELLTTMDSWTSTLSGIWKPQSYDASRFLPFPDESRYPADHPFRHFQCPRVLRYVDISLACIWTFYSACQIVLREAYIQLAIYSTARARPDQSSVEERISEEKDAIGRLSSSVIRSFPILMGFAEDSHPAPSPQGRMVGRFLGLFSMVVIQRAEFTSLEHKQTASKVVEWIIASHKL